MMRWVDEIILLAQQPREEVLTDQPEPEPKPERPKLPRAEQVAADGLWRFPVPGGHLYWLAAGVPVFVPEVKP